MRASLPGTASRSRRRRWSAASGPRWPPPHPSPFPAAAPLVDRIVHSTRAGVAKPDPAIFHLALEALGVPPAEALHAGNEVVADVEGARAAGLRAVLVDREGRLAPLPPGVPRVRTLAELVARLES